jgi:hypothetical protein
VERGLAGTAHVDASREEEDAGAGQDAGAPPAAELVPPAADRGDAAGQEQDGTDVGHRFGQQRDARPALFSAGGRSGGEQSLPPRPVVEAADDQAYGHDEDEREWTQHGSQPRGGRPARHPR